MLVVGINPSQVDTIPGHLLGSYGQVNDDAGSRIYKYVQYAEGAGALDLAAGDVVHYVDDTGYGANSVSADVSDLTGKGIVAGVAPAAVTADGSYFWVQIKGAATLAVALETSNDAAPVAAGDGDPLVIGDADKALRRDNTVIDADAERVQVCAVAIDASAAEVALDCIW